MIYYAAAEDVGLHFRWKNTKNISRDSDTARVGAAAKVVQQSTNNVITFDRAVIKFWRVQSGLN